MSSEKDSKKKTQFKKNEKPVLEFAQRNLVTRLFGLLYRGIVSVQGKVTCYPLLCLNEFEETLPEIKTKQFYARKDPFRSEIPEMEIPESASHIVNKLFEQYEVYYEKEKQKKKEKEESSDPNKKGATFLQMVHDTEAYPAGLTFGLVIEANDMEDYEIGAIFSAITRLEKIGSHQNLGYGQLTYKLDVWIDNQKAGKIEKEKTFSFAGPVSDEDKTDEKENTENRVEEKLIQEGLEKYVEAYNSYLENLKEENVLCPLQGEEILEEEKV